MRSEFRKQYGSKLLALFVVIIMITVPIVVYFNLLLSIPLDLSASSTNIPVTFD